MSKKIKIVVVLILLILFLILIWWLFFANNKTNVLKVVKNNAEQNSLNKNSKEKTKTDEEKKEDDEKEFKNFGNFWIEIHKDDLDIKAPIVNGTQEADLAKGVGHHPTTSYPSKDGGNVVLSGHRFRFGGNPAYKVFKNLDELENGDEISLFYFGKEYVYKVRDQKVVKDSDVSILKNTDKSQLTLYTCTPIGTAFRRLVYIADLEKVL